MLTVRSGSHFNKYCILSLRAFFPHFLVFSGKSKSRIVVCLVRWGSVALCSSYALTSLPPARHCISMWSFYYCSTRLSSLSTLGANLLPPSVLASFPVAGIHTSTEATQGRKGSFGSQFQVTQSVAPGIQDDRQELGAATHAPSTVKSRGGYTLLAQLAFPILTESRISCQGMTLMRVGGAFSP